MTSPLEQPSVLMGTITSFFGIFIAIFTLAIQGLDTNSKKFRRNLKYSPQKEEFDIIYDTALDIFVNSFIIISIFVFIIVTIDAEVIFFNTDNVFSDFYTSEIFIFTGFILIFMAIVSLCYYMISFSCFLAKNNTKFEDLKSISEKLDFISKKFGIISKKLNFHRVVVFLAINSICIAICFYLVNKFYNPLDSSIFLCVLLGLFMWFLLLGKIRESFILFSLALIYFYKTVFKQYITDTRIYQNIKIPSTLSFYEVFIIPIILLLIILLYKTIRKRILKKPK
jgi:hypothetical protein